MDSAPALSPGPQSGRAEPSPEVEPQTELMGRLWRIALHPGVVAAVAIAVLLLVVAAFFLPQLPDDLRDEPAASSRWLLETASAYGAAGPLLRGVGLFSVFYSFLFRLGLALLTLLLAVHLAAQAGNALAVQHLRSKLCALQEVGLRRELGALARTIYQERRAVDHDVIAVQNQTVDLLNRQYDTVDVCRHSAETDTAASGDVTEHRSFGVRNGRSYWLRPFLPLGLLVALVVVWIFLIAGWEWQSPMLAPGDTVRFPAHDVVLSYTMEEEIPGQPAEGDLVIQIGNRSLTETTSERIRAHIGASSISGRSGEPALLIRVADGSPVLAKPGQSESTDSVGVVLPSPGSEESVLLPDLSSGLRTVRRTDDPSAFIVELYQGAETRPRERIEVEGPTTASVTAGDQRLELELIPVPGVEITIRHMPGKWLLWIALALSVVGFLGVLVPPASALTQVASWSATRAVLTVYSSDLDELETIEDAAGGVGS